MNLQMQAKLEVRCVAFLERKVGMFDTRKLEYFRLYDRTGKTKSSGVWGRCTFPNHKKKLGYRIRCSVAISAREFPHRVRYSIGTRRSDQTQWQWVWREDSFHIIEEAFVWIAGHEAYHWLRHSRQIPGQNYETQANRYGFLWLDEWRTLTPEGDYEPGNGEPDRMVVDQSPPDKVDTSLARIYYTSGRVTHFKDPQFALKVWRTLSKGIGVAFRGPNDKRPVYPWDEVDAV